MLFLLKILFGLFITFVSKVSRLSLNNRYNFNNSVAIIALHKLGDTVFTIPALLEYLKGSSSNVHIYCYKESEIIYRQVIEKVNYRQVSKSDFYFNGRIAGYRIRKALKALKPDYIIDMTGSVTSASLIFGCQCYKIYGINETFYKGIYSNYNKIRIKPHQVDIYFDAIQGLISDNQREFKGFGNKYKNDGLILIHPLAGWAAKEWGLLNFINLYKKLNKNNECSFIFPSSVLKKDILEQLDLEKIKYIECVDTEKLIKIIKSCKFFISNDSGPLQIAALLKKPTFCIYGPTNPEYHVPFGKYHYYVNKHLNCTPFIGKYCFEGGGRNCLHFECMKLLTVEVVYQSVFAKLIELKKSNTEIGTNS